MKVWLQPSILSWLAHEEGGTYVDFAQRRRAYEHLHRAEYFIAPNATASAHDRADCISNLRKCLTHRLQFFESVYNLRKNVAAPRSRHYIDLLADLGVIRRSLLQDLLKVRNKIEYDDSEPPSISKCRHFCDTVWYFLRATDALLHIDRSSVMLTPPDAPPWNSVYSCHLRIRYVRRFAAEISRWLPPYMVSRKEIPAALLVRAERLKAKAEVPHLRSLHEEKADTDVWIIGKVVCGAAERHEVIRLALNAV